MPTQFPNPPSKPALLTVDQLAELLGVSPRHVYRLANRKLLPKPVKLGHSVRFNRSVIDRWLDAGCPPMDQFEGGNDQ